MTDVLDIWVGQNGEKLGPFSETAVRKWMVEGKFAPDALGWRTGMAAWAPLTTVMRANTPPPPPPQPAPPPAAVLRTERPIAPQPQQRYYRREPARAEVTLPEPTYTTPPGHHYHREPSFNARQAGGSRGYGDAVDRSAIPMPPTLHWGLVAAFSILTLGIFGLVWRFVQANWVRKIDGKSKAALFFGLGLAALVTASLLPSMGKDPPPDELLMDVMFLLVRLGLILANAVLFLVGYFSMAASIRRAMRAHGEPFETSDIILFFFNIYYIQGQLSWIGHWKRTGQTEPPPPKAMLWVLLIAPIFVIAILAAIAIPAYQKYIVRAQGMESIAISADARNHVADFYNRSKRYPRDNTEATLPAGTKITGKYVSQVEVDHGKVTVYYDSVKASTQLIGRHIVFTPIPNGTQMTWECRSESDVEEAYLPNVCR